MKKLALISTLLVLSWINNTAVAAIFIQMQDAHRQTTNIYIERNKARIELTGHRGYIVLDLDNRMMKAVIHSHKTVLDMSEFLKPGLYQQPAKYVDTYTKTMGLGPTVIGYETEEYGLYANDQYCGSIYVSVAAMRDMGVTKFARAFIELEKNMRTKLQALTGINSRTAFTACEVSQLKANLKLRDIGFPLKSVGKNKRLVSIVTSVNKNAKLPANAFYIPPSYTEVDPSKLIQKTMQLIPPQMQEMIKNMTPEMRRQMQQQLQHYQ